MRTIPFSPPDIGEDEIREVSEVLRSGWITTGPKTKQFEREIADYCGTSKAVCLNSATAAMECTLRVLGIGEGDEVITSAYTYTASASVIHHVGATIKMCDTTKDGFEMDYDKLADMITEKTKAIIAVDLAGRMCDYDKLFSVVESKKALFNGNNDIQKGFGRVVVIADGAHSFGADYKGKKAGSVADFTSFSFHAVKNLTTAEGGAVTWIDRDFIDNEALYKNYMLLSLHGQNKDALSKTKAGAWEYDIIAPLYKCNMTDIMAAIGLAQLHRYEDMLKLRRRLIEIYNEELCDERFMPLVHYSDDFNSSGHLYLLRIKEISSDKRNEIIEKMAEQGISCNVHYKPLPLLTAYKNLGFDIKDYPNAYGLFENEITLPLNTKMTEDDAYYVAKTLKSIL
ncbi:MAG: DegT/DnrJ/EryC1/StrS family aminotransferase [Clostridia bacterium]|nr:DegT/DnrJ/EryC1/StrS family aminotransferase [Clostridia bacterium]